MDPVVQDPLLTEWVLSYKETFSLTDRTSNRPFTAVEDQIDLLKSRGLEIDSDEKAIQFLLFKNYYNFINRYGQYFFESNTQTFLPGTNFNDILNLYFFDNDLKHSFYRKIMKVETHFKSVMAHVFCKNHEQEFAYLNPKNFDPLCKEDHISFIGSLANNIKYNSGSKVPDNPIKHHMKKYGHVPFWVLVNYMYLTDTVKFYGAMNKSEQNEILRIFFQRYSSEFNINVNDGDIITPEQLGSFLKLLNDYRNLIAHDNFLFGTKVKTLTKYCDCVHRDFYDSRDQVKRSLYDTLIIMRVFLEYKSYMNLHNKILKLLNKLLKKSSQQDVNKILVVMGFPVDWNIQDSV